MKSALGISILFLGMSILEARLPEEALAQRIYAHLILKDPRAALEEINQSPALLKNSQAIQKAHIEVLASLGETPEALKAWRTYNRAYPEEKGNRELLETVAWGIVSKAARSPALNTRAMALIAAYHGNDSRGVLLLSDSLRSSNALLRGLAVEVAGRLLDERLKEQVSQMLETERLVTIRVALMRAAGQMGATQAQAFLEQTASNPQSRAEEKSAAIEALSLLIHDPTRPMIEALVFSNRAALRELACELLAQQEAPLHADLLLLLLEDHHPKIRALALQTLCLLTPKEQRTEEWVRRIQAKWKDPDPTVALSAAWGLSSSHFPQCLPVFQSALQHSSQDIRLTAASMLASTGLYGVDQMTAVLKEHRDPYVRINLAMGLIGLRHELPLACSQLHQILKENPERWMWKEKGNFRSLAPSDLHHKEGVPNYPEIVNQVTRLEVLNMLAMVQSGEALDAIKHFLKERSWGVSGIAASLLIAEGDAEMFKLISSLLEDPHPKIRIQAALVLALWGHDPKPVALLQASYREADYTLKAMILEALGQVGHEISIPFLINTLAEPSEQMRLIAATSLLNCLNH